MTLALLCQFTAQHISDEIHPSSGACDYLVRYCVGCNDRGFCVNLVVRVIPILCVVSKIPFDVNHLKPTGHVLHQQFNIQQLYALPTLYLCVLYLSENKQRLVPLTA